jgi:hypothetical protein
MLPIQWFLGYLFVAAGAAEFKCVSAFPIFSQHSSHANAHHLTTSLAPVGGGILHLRLKFADAELLRCALRR